MANINLTRSVEFADVKMWLFTNNEDVVIESTRLYKTENTNWLDKLTAKYAAEKKAKIIKYEVVGRGNNAFTLPLRDFVSIAKVKEETIIELTETVEREV